MRYVTSGMQQVLDSKQGTVDYKISVYDTCFAYPSSGIREDILYRYSSYESPSESDGFIFHYDARGRFLASDLRRPHLREYYPNGIPLGVTEKDLERTISSQKYNTPWSVRWTGYIYVPANSYVTIWARSNGGLELSAGTYSGGWTSDHRRGKDISVNIRTTDASTTGWMLPFQVVFSSATPVYNYPMPTKEYYASVLWKYTYVAGKWKVLDCSRAVYDATFQNINGDLCEEVIAPPFLNPWDVDDSDLWGSSGSITNGGNTLSDSGKSWEPDELIGGKVAIVDPSTNKVEAHDITDNTSTQITIDGTWSYDTGTYYYYIYDIPNYFPQDEYFDITVPNESTLSAQSSVSGSGTGTVGTSQWIKIRIPSSGGYPSRVIYLKIKDEYTESRAPIGSLVRVYAPYFLSSLVDEDKGIPNVKSLNVTRSEASTASFTVTTTSLPFDKNRLNKDNCYSLDPNTGSFGILKPGKLVDIALGYDVEDGTYQIFRGFIRSVQINENATELRVDCTDLSSLLSESFFEGQPFPCSYDSIFADRDVEEIDTAVKPRCYDGWTPSDAIRDIALYAGITEASLDATDDDAIDKFEEMSSTLPKNKFYPRERGWSRGQIQSDEFKWKFGYGDDMLSAIKRITDYFGLIFFIDGQGDVNLQTANNPEIVANYTGEDVGDDYFELDSANTYFWSIQEPDSTKYIPVRGFQYWVDPGQNTTGKARIYFTGTGIALSVERVLTSAASGPIKFRCYIDGKLVDGNNIIDSSTGSIGSIDYLTQLDSDGYFDVRGDFSEPEPGLGVRHYLDGIDPRMGYNPCLIHIATDLTYTSHTLEVEMYSDNYQPVKVDAAFVYKRSRTAPVFSFTTSNIQGPSPTDSDEDLRNDIIVVGSIRGAEGNYVVSRALDLMSLRDPNSPNFIGRRRPIVIIDPAISSQSYADYISTQVLQIYRSPKREVSISSFGLPFLELWDCVSITADYWGLTSSVQYYQMNKQTFVWDMMPKYWISEITHSLEEDGSYTVSIQLHNVPPLPSFVQIPDPPYSLMHEDSTSPGSIYPVYLHWMTSSPYNPYEFERYGRPAELKMIVGYNLKYLTVQIFSKSDYDDNITGVKLRQDQLLNTLKVEKEYIQRGRYKLTWDGYWATEDKGGSKGGGMLVPSGFGSADVSVVAVAVSSLKNINTSFAFISDKLDISYDYSVFGDYGSEPLDDLNDDFAGTTKMVIEYALPYRINGTITRDTSKTYPYPFDSYDTLLQISGASSQPDVYIICDNPDYQGSSNPGKARLYMSLGREGMMHLRPILIRYQDRLDSSDNFEHGDSTPPPYLLNRKNSIILSDLCPRDTALQPNESPPSGATTYAYHFDIVPSDLQMTRMTQQGEYEFVGYNYCDLETDPTTWVSKAVAWLVYMLSPEFSDQEKILAMTNSEKRFVDLRIWSYHIPRPVIFYWCGGYTRTFSSSNVVIKSRVGNLRYVPFVKV